MRNLCQTLTATQSNNQQERQKAEALISTLVNQQTPGTIECLLKIITATEVSSQELVSKYLVERVIQPRCQSASRSSLEAHCLPMLAKITKLYVMGATSRSLITAVSRNL